MAAKSGCGPSGGTLAIVTKMCELGYARGEVVEDVIGGCLLDNADIKFCPFVCVNLDLG